MDNGFLLFSVPSLIPEIQEMGTLRIRQAAEPMEWEEHEEAFELLYVKSGEKKMTVGGQEYHLVGGDLLVIHPGEIHGNYCAVQNRSSLHYLLICDPVSYPGFLGLNDKERSFLSQKLLKIRKVKLTAETKKLYLNLFERPQQQWFSSQKTAALCLLMLFGVCEESGEAELGVPQNIQRAVDYVQQHKADMPQVGELAGIAGLSEPHFKQKFKQYIGLPPGEYVARTHVEQAERCLMKTDHSITQVALSLGFSSSQHFSKLFRRYKGMSPSEYRKQREKEV